MIIAIYTILLIVYILLAIYLLYTFYGMIVAAPFVPTSKKNVKIMIDMVKPQANETLFDLGSGDGRILHLAAKSGCKCIGIEINPILYHWSRLTTKLKRLKNVEIRRKNLWKTDLSSVNILTLFFIAGKMDKLHKKILSEMKPGSRIVSHGFKFPNWQYSEKSGKIYLYQVPHSES